MFGGVRQSAREAVLELAEQIQTARQELEYHEQEAAARRALLVELEQATKVLHLGAVNASRRRRVLDATRSGRMLPP